MSRNNNALGVIEQARNDQQQQDAVDAAPSSRGSSNLAAMRPPHHIPGMGAEKESGGRRGPSKPRVHTRTLGEACYRHDFRGLDRYAQPFLVDHIDQYNKNKSMGTLATEGNLHHRAAYAPVTSRAPPTILAAQPVVPSPPRTGRLGRPPRSTTSSNQQQHQTNARSKAAYFPVQGEFPPQPPADLAHLVPPPAQLARHLFSTVNRSGLASIGISQDAARLLWPGFNDSLLVDAAFAQTAKKHNNAQDAMKAQSTALRFEGFYPMLRCIAFMNNMRPLFQMLGRNTAAESDEPGSPLPSQPVISRDEFIQLGEQQLRLKNPAEEYDEIVAAMPRADTLSLGEFASWLAENPQRYADLEINPFNALTKKSAPTTATTSEVVSAPVKQSAADKKKNKLGKLNKAHAAELLHNAGLDAEAEAVERRRREEEEEAAARLAAEAAEAARLAAEQEQEAEAEKRRLAEEEEAARAARAAAAAAKAAATKPKAPTARDRLAEQARLKKEKEEAEKLKKEEAKKAAAAAEKERREKLAKEKAERDARLAALRKKKEEEDAVKKAAEDAEAEEKKRLAAEKKAEEDASAAAKAKEDAEREAKERADAEFKAARDAEDAARRAQEEADEKKRQQEEAGALADALAAKEKEKADRKAAEQAAADALAAKEKEKADREAAEQAAVDDAARKAAAAKALADAEAKAAAEKAAREAEEEAARKAKEDAAAEKEQNRRDEIRAYWNSEREQVVPHHLIMPTEKKTYRDLFEFIRDFDESVGMDSAEFDKAVDLLWPGHTSASCPERAFLYSTKKDGKRIADADELTNVLQFIVYANNLQPLFENVDENGTGTVSFEEFEMCAEQFEIEDAAAQWAEMKAFIKKQLDMDLPEGDEAGVPFDLYVFWLSREKPMYDVEVSMDEGDE